MKHKTAFAAAFLLGAAMLALQWGTCRQPPSAAPPPPDSPHRLLRPLAHRLETRFAGALAVPPRRGYVTDVGPGEEQLVVQLERACADALRANDADVGALVDFARRMLWIGHWTVAEDAAAALLARAPDYAPALALSSAVRYEQGRRREGARLAEQALTIDARQPLALVGRARATAASRGPDAAEPELLAAIDLDPDEPLAPFLLASLWFDAHRFAAAAPWFARSREFLPDPVRGRAAYIDTGLALTALLAGREPCRTAGGFAGVEVPLLRTPLIAVRGTLHGRGRQLSGLFVIDCGASTTVLGAAAAELARPTHTAPVMASVSGQQTTGAGLLDGMTIGELRVDDIPVLLDRSQGPPLAPGAIAVLGVAWLRHFLVTLDLPGERCRFDPLHARQPGPAPLAEVPFELVTNQILVPASFAGGKERTFLFDTGATALFVAPEVIAEEFGRLPARRSSQTGFDGREVPAVEMPMPRPLQFGGRTLQLDSLVADPTATMRNRYARLENAGTLGLVIRARYVLDFHRQRLSLWQ